MMTDNKKQLLNNDQLLALMRSGRRSLRRKRRMAASSVVAALAAAAVATPMLFQPDSPSALEQESPIIVSTQPISDALEAAPPVAAPSDNRVRNREKATSPTPSPISVANNIQQAGSDPEETNPAEPFATDLFAEIMASEYTTIMWNDGAEADSVVSRLHQLLNKKDV